MPDSLTKFKKDAPKKTTAAPVTNASGGTVNTTIINEPTYIYFGNTNNDIVLEYEKEAAIELSGDNDFSSETSMKNILLGCTITPAFPTGHGVVFDPTTCKITGTPTQVYTNTSYTATKGKQDFTITARFANASGGVSSLSRAFKFQILAKPTTILYSQTKNVKLEVTGTGIASFSDSNGKLTTDDGKPTSDTTKNIIRGVVKTVDTTNGLIGVSNSAYYDNDFPAGRTYTDANNNSTPDSDASNAHYYFTVGDKLDSDDDFFQLRASVTGVRNIIASVGSAPASCPSATETANCTMFLPLSNPEKGINLDDATTKRNYLEFTVSPKLPVDTSTPQRYSFSLDKLTGRISGYSTIPLTGGEYTITASNTLGSASTVVKFSVIEAPSHVSYSNRQLLSLSALAFSYVKEGDTIVAPITPPKTFSVKGIITKALSATNEIEVQTTNGTFEKDTPIDIGPTYHASIGSVLTAPLNFTLALVMNAPVTIPAGGTIEGDLFLQNPTALPVVTSRLYVNTTNTSSVSIDDAILTSTVAEIDSTSLKLKLSGSAGSIVGYDVVSSTAKSSGYVYDQTTSAPYYAYVSDLFRSVNTSDTTSRFLREGDTVYFNERAGTGTSQTIAAAGTGNVTYDNYFSAERNIYFEIQSNLKAGTGLTYTVTPTLPRGLSLDQTTGLISGTPLEATALNTYTITAKNLINSSTVLLKLEVRDYFTLTEVSGAPSYRTHKVGDYQNGAGCRINGTDIYNQRGNLDIRCEIDGEEEDIHFFGLQLQSAVGPGICQFVQITPYHFWKWAPKQTNGTILRWDNSVGVIPSDRTVTSELDCDGNYTSEGGPNCDEGTLTVLNYVNDSNGQRYNSTSTISCGGKISNCMDGPITDLLNTTQIQSGMRGLIYSSAAGLTQQWKFSSPSSKGDLTNLRIANNTYVHGTAGSKGSKQGDTPTEVDEWSSMNYTGSIPLTTILSTSFYSGGVGNKNFYSTAQYNINGVPRGAFITENDGKGVAPYKTVTVRSTLGPFQGNYPYYQIACLDAAKESKATITVIVRDWNKSFKLQSEIDKAEPIGMREGICSNSTYTTSAGCTGAGATWRDYSDFGTCSDGVSTTKAACLAVPATWTTSQGMCSDATSRTKSACTTASAVWFDNLMRPIGGTLLNPTNFFEDWSDDFTGNGAASYNVSCSNGTSTTRSTCEALGATWTVTRPTYTAPAIEGDVPTMVFPAATEFQFPEDGI